MSPLFYTVGASPSVLHREWMLAVFISARGWLVCIIERKGTTDLDNIQMNRAFCGDFIVYRRAEDWHKWRSKWHFDCYKNGCGWQRDVG